MSKYGNAMAGGSMLERAVEQLLRLREKAGDILDLECQQTIVLQEGNRSMRITWRVDFAWKEPKNFEICYGEAKGFPTPEYKLKLKLFRANFTNRLEIWSGSYKRPVLMEVVNP